MWSAAPLETPASHPAGNRHLPGTKDHYCAGASQDMQASNPKLLEQESLPTCRCYGGGSVSVQEGTYKTVRIFEPRVKTGSTVFKLLFLGFLFILISGR